jgi:hypothetical protein
MEFKEISTVFINNLLESFSKQYLMLYGRKSQGKKGQNI